jgi:hypothetical protein
MKEVQIRPVMGGWAAFDGERQVSKSACKSCVIKIMLKLTKDSKVYSMITVRDKNGNVEISYETGDKVDGRNAKNS